jgi:23S rRNA (adenine2503-C2)-methyltransferase
VDPEQLQAWMAARGLPAYRATQVLSWVYRRRVRSFAAMSNLPHKLRENLATAFVLPAIDPAVVAEARDGTRKLLLHLADGAAVESVIIPDPPRLTLCISSQAGCGMGCTFCATARLGLRRNLTAWEIVTQVLAAQERLGREERLTNIVFMGMGEPLANYDAVVQAIRILTAEWGIGLSARRITVSTVGLVPAMHRLVADTAVNLAVSLTATTDEQRDRLMPINRRYPLAALMTACRELPIPQRRRITFEYVMLAGINDTIEDAHRLTRLLRGIRSKVNLIPFNPFPSAGFAPSPAADLARFQQILLAAGVNATIRASRGQDIQAACGQLALAETPPAACWPAGAASHRDSPSATPAAPG